MSIRSSTFNSGRPGGRVEYRGDLPAPTTTYASVMRGTSLGDHLKVPPSSGSTGSAVVARGDRRGGIRCFYSHGGYRMPNALPGNGATGPGEVNRSAFQQVNVQLFQWHVPPSLYEAGYPRNLGLSAKTPQLQTNVTGAPGQTQMGARPIFNRVQTVGRARAVVRSYPTRAAAQ